MSRIHCRTATSVNHRGWQGPFFRPAGGDLVLLRRLIWLYVGLLMFEGALRKWALPSLSAPLLIVRDPVVLLIYVQAIRCRRFPVTRSVVAYFVLLIWFGLLGLVQIMNGIGGGTVVVTYGLRTDFLHLPLIFVLPCVFDYDDVVKLGKSILLLTPPMAVLMGIQFLSSPGSWINATAGGEGYQIQSAMGKIRPAGTFSFATGSAHFFALATVFVIFGFAEKNRTYPRWLLWAAVFSLLAVQPLSGNRTLVLSCALVFAVSVVFALMHPTRMRGFLRLTSALTAAAFTLPFFSFFREGMAVFAARWNTANAASGGVEQGILLRFLSTFTDPLEALPQLTLLGQGIGLGTNVGAQLTSGHVHFVLAEGEWARNILEAGVLLGSFFLAYRVWLAFSLGAHSVLAARSGKMLPMLLAGTACLSLVTEAIQQPTNLGFMVLTSGLCMAAISRSKSRAKVVLSESRWRVPRFDKARWTAGLRTRE